MSKISPTKQEWLWQGTVPIGSTSVWFGDGENAKSLTTLELSARGSRGEPMPGESEGHPPFSTLIVTSEDCAESTILPRLVAAEADCSRVHLVPGTVTVDENETTFDVAKHIDQLAETIDALDNCRLVVFDPISEFMPSTNFWKDDSLRQGLAPLTRLAEQKRIAIVLIAHTNKADVSAKQKINGAGALINTARAAWLFCPHPDDSEVYLMLRAKGNISKRSQRGFQFTVQTATVAGADVPRIVWMDDQPELTADEALARERRKMKAETGSTTSSTKFEIAQNWLRTMLASGPKFPKEIEFLHRGLDFSKTTLDRAKGELGVVKNELGQLILPVQAVA